MTLTAEQMLFNLDRLREIISSSFTGERKEKLLRLYSDWGLRIATAPASGKKSYHNCFAGGYVMHVLNVVKASTIILDAWETMGGDIDFSKEELLFAAINHDLGKIGDEVEDYYVPCQEEWMKKKGQVYVNNPKLQYMKVADRSLMILANRGISMSDKEYLGIKLHDGLYEDSNKAYFMSYSEDYQLKTLLPYILHQADLLSSKVEPALEKKLMTVPSSTPLPIKTGNKSLDKFLNE